MCLFLDSNLFFKHLPFFFSLQESCLSVQQTIEELLGPYALNVTSAAKLCSHSLCSSHGRCVRKTTESSSYLHMPEDSQKDYAPDHGFRFVTSARSKLKTIMAMKNGFVCHCYYGWHGESCRSRVPNLLWQKSKAPVTTLNLLVFLGMTLAVILMNFFLIPDHEVNFFLKYEREENIIFL